MKNKLASTIVGIFLSFYSSVFFAGAQEARGVDITESEPLPTPLIEQGAYSTLEKAGLTDDWNKTQEKATSRDLFNAISLYGWKERAFKTPEETRRVNFLEHYALCFEEELNRRPYYLREKEVEEEWTIDEGEFPFKGQALTAAGNWFFERYKIGQVVKKTIEKVRDKVSVKYTTPQIKFRLRPMFNEGDLDSLEANSRLSLRDENLTFVNRTGLEESKLGLEKIFFFGQRKRDKLWVYAEIGYNWEDNEDIASIRVVKKY